MVVEFRSMSNVNFAILDFRSLISEPWHLRWLMLCAGGRPGKGYAAGVRAGGMRIVAGTFSMSHRPVGQVIFADDSLGPTRWVVNRQTAFRDAGVLEKRVGPLVPIEKAISHCLNSDMLTSLYRDMAVRCLEEHPVSM